MSRTLSKILVICAMVVVFPLMIVGTAFASFYSIEATTAVEVYTGSHEVPTDAFAQVQYGEQANTKLTIAEGHLNEIQIKTLSNGYDFVGWYAGTLKDYTADENPEFISAEKTLKAKTVDYENLVAVFELKSYTLSWNYIANPENTAEVSTTAPEGAKAEYYWGDALPVLSYDHYDFKGWTVEGDETFYSAAKFENSGAVVANALANSWQSHGQVEVRYYDEDKNIINDATETIYKGSVVAIKNPSDVVTLEDGYKYSWKDSNNFTVSGSFSIPKEFEGESVNFYLNKETATYTANLTENAEATYNTASVSFTVKNKTALENLFNEENWNKYSFHEIAGISFNETTYTTTDELSAAIVASSKNNNATVELEVVLKKYFETFTVKEVDFNIAIFQKDEEIEETNYSFGDKVGGLTSQTVEEWLDIAGKTFVDSTEDDAKVVDVVNLRIWVNGEFSFYNVTRETVFADIIESILTKYTVGNDSVFEIEKIIVNFSQKI